MKPERWPQVREVLDRAIALLADQRVPYLDEVCSGDAELRSEVDSLLGSYDGAGRAFLEDPLAALRGVILDMGAPPNRIGGRIGVYQIVEEIGHGGMPGFEVPRWRCRVRLRHVLAGLGDVEAEP